MTRSQIYPSRQINAVARKPEQVGFLLIPGFGLLSYAAALEPLRGANDLSGWERYRWHHLSPDGKPTRASNGVIVSPDLRLEEAEQLDLLFVCAGGNPSLFRDRATLRRLRRLGRTRMRIGGLSAGPYILARAGLLDGYSVTLHWEHAAAFREEFPNLDLRFGLFEFDRNRLTCGGGIAALDMIHALLARDHGPELAMKVSEWFLQTQVREGQKSQRISLSQRLGITSQPMLKVVACMERNLETPLTREELAAVSGLSVRQLERLFKHQLRRTPGEYYLRLRLERARALLRESGLQNPPGGHRVWIYQLQTISRARIARCFSTHPGKNDQRGASPAALRRRKTTPQNFVEERIAGG